MKKTLLIIGIALDIIISLVLLFGCTPAPNETLTNAPTQTQTTTETNDKGYTFKVDKIVLGDRCENPTIIPSPPAMVG